MADNLKVNAKTKILTFKKKHNLLVENHNNLREDVDIIDNSLEELKEHTFNIYEYDGDISEIDIDVYNEINERDIIIDETNNLFYVQYKSENGLTLFSFTSNPSYIYYEFYVEDGNLEIDIATTTRLQEKIYTHIITTTESGTTKTYEFLSIDVNKKASWNSFSSDFKKYGGTFTKRVGTGTTKIYKMLNFIPDQNNTKVYYMEEDGTISYITLSTAISMTNYRVV